MTAVFLFWIPIGLIYPKAVLWWAAPDKITQGNAFKFGISCLVFIFSIKIALNSSWWLWIFVLFMASFVYGYYQNLKMTKDEVDFATGKRKEVYQQKVITQNIIEVIETHNTNEAIYTVDLSMVTCTCHNFIKLRKNYDIFDPRRLCKHLLPLMVAYEKHYRFTNHKELEEYAKRPFYIGYNVNEKPKPQKSYYEDDDYDDNDDDKQDWTVRWEKDIARYLGHSPSSSEDKYYIEAFGGDEECIYNLSMYSSRKDKGATCFTASKTDHYRPRYEVLAKTDVLKKGKEIAPSIRLEALKIDELRIIQKSLGAAGAKKKTDIIANLKTFDSAVIEKEISQFNYNIDDFFYIDPQFN